MEIEELELEVKVYNRLKKAGINTTDELLSEMYKGSSDIKVSAPDAKRCEEALKAVGIIKYVRGDYVTEDDIEPEPLTWDELHNCIGKLVVFDCSTESHRWLKVKWIYDIKDDGEGTAICSDGSRDYNYIRRSQVNGDYSRNPEFLKTHKCLKYEGRFFALKQSTPLDKLGLSVRTYNAAKRYGIDTVEELTERIEDFSKHAPHSGKEAKELLNIAGGASMQEQQVMSVDYTKAVTLTRHIKANAQAAQESLWEVCKGLKEMHDGKLYKELGYQHFKEYCENELEVTDRQARNYIYIADSFSDEERKSISALGTTKLLLLAKLDEPQREEVQQNVDVEAVSVRELKKQIAALNNEAAKQRKLREELVDENNQMSNRISALLADNDEAKDTIQSLEQQLEELEERPIDVAVQTLPDDEEIEKLTAQFKEDLAKHEKGTERRLEELRQHYRKELKEQYDRLTKEAEQANVDVEEEIAEKAELECTIKFATDALRRLARYVMSIDSEDKAYARYAIKKVDEVYDILRKFEEEK